MGAVVRVVGPPGTGKTRTLVDQARRAVELAGRERVVVGTFTRKGAGTVAARLGEQAPRHVGTFHALARRALAAQTGGPIRVLQDREGLRLFDEMHPQWESQGSSLLNSLSRRDATGVCDRPPHVLAQFDRDWGAFEREFDGYSFDSLIRAAIREGAYPNGGDVAWTFHDEAQDSSPLEHAYLDAMLRDSGSHLFDFGDEHQSLYGFRGATADGFMHRHAKLEVLLDQSFRVPHAVLRTAKAFMARQRITLPAYHARPEEGASLRRHGSPKSRDHDFARMVLETARDAESMMVLAPTMRGTAGLRSLLQEWGVPYGSADHDSRPWSPLGSSEDLPARVAAFLTPELQGRQWTWSEVDSWVGISRTLLKNNDSRRLIRQRKASAIGGVSDELLRDVLSPAAYRAAMARDTDLLLELAHLRESHRRFFRYCVAVGRTSGLEYLYGTRKPNLHVSTIHGAKGGEADIVWVADDLGRRFADTRATTSGLREIANLFYVAMTRAKRELAIVGAGRHNANLARFV